MEEIIPKFKLWFELKGIPVLGKGEARLLEEISLTKSITKAAERTSIPYRTAWQHLRKIEERVGKPLIKRHKGGFKGGGGAELTLDGEKILKEYEHYEEYIKKELTNKEYWEAIELKISARNKLSGAVREVKIGKVAATIKIEVSEPQTVTALITKEAAEDLGIKVGDKAEAVIKPFFMGSLPKFQGERAWKN
jgi:molybdate transport system regulatory protein